MGWVCLTRLMLEEWIRRAQGAGVTSRRRCCCCVTGVWRHGLAGWTGWGRRECRVAALLAMTGGGRLAGSPSVWMLGGVDGGLATWIYRMDRMGAAGMPRRCAPRNDKGVDAGCDDWGWGFGGRKGLVSHLAADAAVVGQGFGDMDLQDGQDGASELPRRCAPRSDRVRALAVMTGGGGSEGARGRCHFSPPMLLLWGGGLATWIYRMDRMGAAGLTRRCAGRDDWG